MAEDSDRKQTVYTLVLLRIIESGKVSRYDCRPVGRFTSKAAAVSRFLVLHELDDTIDGYAISTRVVDLPSDGEEVDVTVADSDHSEVTLELDGAAEDDQEITIMVDQSHVKDSPTSP